MYFIKIITNPVHKNKSIICNVIEYSDLNRTKLSFILLHATQLCINELNWYEYFNIQINWQTMGSQQFLIGFKEQWVIDDYWLEIQPPLLVWLFLFQYFAHMPPS